VELLRKKAEDLSRNILALSQLQLEEDASAAAEMFAQIAQESHAHVNKNGRTEGQEGSVNEEHPHTAGRNAPLIRPIGTDTKGAGFEKGLNAFHQELKRAIRP